MGKSGALLVTPYSAKIIPPYKPDKVVDTTGAGDAFSAGFIYGFFQNSSFEFDDLRYNAKIGNFVAGKCIEKLGARKGIPDVEEVKSV